MSKATRPAVPSNGLRVRVPQSRQLSSLPFPQRRLLIGHIALVLFPLICLSQLVQIRAQLISMSCFRMHESIRWYPWASSSPSNALNGVVDCALYNELWRPCLPAGLPPAATPPMWISIPPRSPLTFHPSRDMQPWRLNRGLSRPPSRVECVWASPLGWFRGGSGMRDKFRRWATRKGGNDST